MEANPPSRYEPARHENSRTGALLCVECLETIEAGSVADKNGATLCRDCAENFYVACAACAGLVPRDEMLSKPRHK